ncbi:sporulation-specific protein 16 [Monosporozyma servazzii]
MEITRKVYIKPTSALQETFNTLTLIVDINTSLLYNQVQIIKSQNSPKQQIENSLCQNLQKEMATVLTEINNSIHPNELIIINLNLSKLIFPLHIWNFTIDTLLLREKIQFPYHIYITEQTLTDRQDYMDKNINLIRWTENLIDIECLDYNPLVGDEYLDEEIFVKTLLMCIFEENNLTEQRIEMLLTKYNNMEDIINFLRVQG